MDKTKPVFAMIILAAVIAAACGSGSAGRNGSSGGGYASAPQADYQPSPEGENKAYYDDYALSEEAVYGETSYDAGGGMSPEGSASNRPAKIILNGSVQLESDRFDDTMESLRSIPAAFGGYVENSFLQGSGQGDRRVYSVTMRIPREHFEEAKKEAESLGNVVSSNESAEDATARYYDMESRLKTLEIEEERVLSMIDAAVELEDILVLEERLGFIRTDIELYQTRMTNIDRLSSYSTLTVRLSEVTVAEMRMVSDDTGSRMYKSFVKSVNDTVSFLENVMIFLAGAVIPLFLLAILAGAGFAGYKILKKS